VCVLPPKSFLSSSSFNAVSMYIASFREEYSTRLLENVVNESAFVPMRGDGLNESSTVISRLDDR
jgi:hypothetical protein